MEPIRQDVLIVGGGAAGLRAAIAACEADDKVRIGLVSKVYPMRSHTVSAEGGTAAVLKEGDNLDSHAYDTIKGSDFLADQDAVELFVKEAPGEVLRMEHWGCPWSRDPEGKVAVRAFGGMSVKRTVFASDKTGFHMLHTLFQTTLKYEQITRYDEWFVTTLLVDDGKVCGVVALDIRTGEMHPLLAKAVILATGGAGQIFPFTTNGFIKTGDGMSLAYRAGVPLKDMEFVQYHPTGLPGTGILITEAARGEGGHMLNKDGERYLKKYVPNKIELGPRDILSRAFMSEQKEGRTFQGPYGDYVHLDLRHLGAKVINRKLPFVRELVRLYVGIDPIKEPIPVRPVVHYMMGGVHTDVTGKAPMDGLYAAGEVACVTINGANRLGSNSLTECLVFGARAGKAAAEWAAGKEDPPADLLVSKAEEERQRIEKGYLQKEGGKETVAGLRVELKKVMEAGAGIHRDEAGLKEACEKIRSLRARFADVQIQDRSRIFNTELTMALELDAMIDVAEAVAAAALARTESRGSHSRSDHTKRDDENFLKHSMSYRTPEGCRVEYLPATITRWKPEERKY
ncbi:MAG: FAD-binding protein [Planctomycetota bacterium]|nr:FAD-binding protein [Planctomycetota bacterium]